MEQQSWFADSKPQDEPYDFNMKELARGNANSRRFSASNLKSFREDTERSFRYSNITICSTASSPGCTNIRDEIDPSTYSFTTALKALQERSVYRSPADGLTLNSKWNEAEKYISNPLSGRVPVECLSAKTLTQRSRIRGPTRRIAIDEKDDVEITTIQGLNKQKENEFSFLMNNNEEKKISTTTTKDVGTQSTPSDVSRSSPSPVSTPSIQEVRSMKINDGDSSTDDSSTGKKEAEAEVEQVKGTREKQNTKSNEGRERKKLMVMMMTMMLCVFRCRCTSRRCTEGSVAQTKKQKCNLTYLSLPYQCLL